MSDIREDRSEIIHYDNPDFPVFCRFNEIPADAVLSDTSLHWHEDIEFIYVTKGSIIQYINDKKFVLHKGEGIFINSKQIHVVENNGEECNLYCLIMRPTILCASKYVEQNYVTSITDDSRISYILLDETESWKKKVLAEIKDIVNTSNSSGNSLDIMEHIFRMWKMIYHEIIIMEPQEDKEKKVNYSLSIMKKMITFIQAHYMEEINLDDICAEGMVSRTKCAELFAQYVHLTPVEYLICYRLDRASMLLRDTDMSVSEIAFTTGFSGASYFTEAFKKRVGVTPIRYRKANKKYE